MFCFAAFVSLFGDCRISTTVVPHPKWSSAAILADVKKKNFMLSDKMRLNHDSPKIDTTTSLSNSYKTATISEASLGGTCRKNVT
ncbi:MAG TPA: hypothetical protein VFY06_06935 [Verrucomicrobiae bacterium]|nr:hypothetical protein [Verrucomicrobiae bacterium]